MVAVAAVAAELCVVAAAAGVAAVAALAGGGAACAKLHDLGDDAPAFRLQLPAPRLSFHQWQK